MVIPASTFALLCSLASPPDALAQKAMVSTKEVVTRQDDPSKHIYSVHTCVRQSQEHSRDHMQFCSLMSALCTRFRPLHLQNQVVIAMAIQLVHCLLTVFPAVVGHKSKAL